jgi:sulfate/thiosulfate transport system substrate-binding protein
MKSSRFINFQLVIERLIVLGGIISLSLYAIWPWLPFAQSAPARTVVVYGFSILGEVMDEAIFPAFEAQWESKTGENVEFISAFASSGTITNQIILGAPAEVAILSLELDAFRMVDSGVVPGPTWRGLPYAGVVNTTPFVIITRAGNPRQIKGFNDLTQPGVGIVHPDPLTSGGAQWAILAEYGSALRETGDPQQAFDQLLGIWKNVVAQASSARATRTQFESGFGDALITYEQEALRDQLRNQFNGEIIYPHSTVMSEHTVVVIEKNIPDGDEDLVQAFVQFLWSEPAKKIFTEFGFRSMDKSLNAEVPYFVNIADPFTVGDLGGWQIARQEIVEAIWKGKVLPELGK